MFTLYSTLMEDAHSQTQEEDKQIALFFARKMETMDEILKSSPPECLCDYQSKRRFLNRLCKFVCQSSPTDSTVDQQWNDQFPIICKRLAPFLADDENAVLRTVALRTVRKCIRNLQTVEYFIESVDGDLRIARKLELIGDCEEEQLQAFHLASVILHLYASAESAVVSIALTQWCRNIVVPILSLVNAGIQNGADAETLCLPSLALFFDLCIAVPEFALDNLKTDWLTKLIFSPAFIIDRPMLAKLISCVIGFWLSHVKLRGHHRVVKLLETIFAPLAFLEACNQNSAVESSQKKLTKIMHTLGDIMLGILQTWPGLYSVCMPGNSETPGRLTVFILREHCYTKTMFPNTVITMLCRLFAMPFSEETWNNWHQAVEFCRSHNIFRQSKIKRKSRYIHFYRNQASHILIENGWLEALIGLIIADPDESVAIKATLLLYDLYERSALLQTDNIAFETKHIFTSSKSALQTLIYHESTLNSDRSKSTKVLLCRMEELNSIRRMQVHNSDHRNTNNTGRLMPVVRNEQERDGYVFDLIGVAVGAEVSPNWTAVDSVLYVFESHPAYFERYQTNDRCRLFFSQLVYFFMPQQGMHFPDENETFMESIGCRIFNLLLLKTGDEFYVKLVHDFVDDCSNKLQKLDRADESKRCFFAFIRAIGATPIGSGILEKRLVFQKLIEFLLKENLAQHLIRMIVSCLDSSCSDMGRNNLSTALRICNDEDTSLAVLQALDHCFRDNSLSSSNNNHWRISLMLHLLPDQSPRIIETVLELLQEHICTCPEMIHSIPADKLVMFGDAGILLQAAFCANEEFVWRNRALVEQMVDNWNRIFNYRYAEISEQLIREQLTGIQRRNNGFRIRRRDDSPISTDESNSSSPPHLFGGLSSHDCGIEILLSSNAIGQHSLILESAVADQGDDVKNVMAIKSALYVYQSLAERASENISKLVSFDSDLQRISQLSQGHSNLDIRYLAKFCHETMITLQKTHMTKVEKDFD